MDLSDGTNIAEAASDTNTAEAATVVPEDSDVKPTNEVSNSSFRPYYQSTYLLTSNDLLTSHSFTGWRNGYPMMKTMTFKLRNN